MVKVPCLTLKATVYERSDGITLRLFTGNLWVIQRTGTNDYWDEAQEGWVSNLEAFSAIKDLGLSYQRARKVLKSLPSLL
jgi:hypothetical protein